MEVELQYLQNTRAMLGTFHIGKDTVEAVDCVTGLMKEYVATHKRLQKNVGVEVYGTESKLVINLTGDEPPSDVFQIINGMLLENCKKYTFP